MKTIHIHIKGCVQGVGFRPFVYRLAKDHKLNGWVCNTSQGVHIEVTGTELECKNFYKDCIDKAPDLSNIVTHHYEYVGETLYSDFHIVESDGGEEIDLAIMPDLAICEQCKQEMKDPSNRRAGYGFITCTNCGPRFSIIEGLPYDRPFTTMSGFEMCLACQKEYDDPLDRRYYSQTNSCKECGIVMQLFNQSAKINIRQDEVVEKSIDLLRNQKILAVKGVGGYLLVCDASDMKVIEQLRKRKKRPHKPFAVLLSDTDFNKSDLSIEAKHELASPESPIVVVPYNEVSELGIAMKMVAPGLDQVGVMYPYAPLLVLLSHEFNSPLIATSANQSGLPIMYKDNTEEFKELFKYADAILTHNRPIFMPQDDSVVKLTTGTKSRIVLRRSRGMAPNYFHNRSALQDHVLALGAELKSTFAMTRKSNVYVSQYLGNTGTFENQDHYLTTLSEFENVVGAKPNTILTDMHPNYFSNQLGKKRKDQNELHEIQHHEAHMMAVLEENNLLSVDDPVLGVIWDGTGYGHDEQIWGGEFFEYKRGKISRMLHMDYFPILSGDKMALEPRLSALALLGENDCLKDYFTDTEWRYFNKARKKSTIHTSSMGRIFDAVACLVGLISVSTYEGQAAMMLELAATSWYLKNEWSQAEVLNYSIDSDRIILSPAMNELISNLEKETPIDLIAAQFHETLIRIILDVAEKYNYYHMVFSGGVFQNGVLVDLLKLRAQNKNLYFHKNLSPNDENISFGQLIHHFESVSSNNQ